METRKGSAKGAAKPKDEEGGLEAIPGESAEMHAIRFLHSNFALEQQRARDHEARMAALFNQISDKLSGPQGGGPPVVPPVVPPHQGTGVKAFDVSRLEELPSSAKFRQFRLWRDAWIANGKCHKLRLFTREEQVFAFLHAAGVHAAHVLEVHFHIDASADTTTVDVLLARLEAYYRANESVTVDGVRFAERVQAAGETFDDFRFALAELAKDAELCTHCGDRRMLEQLIVGLRDKEARRELLRLKAPTLEDVVDLCRSYEAAERDSASVPAGRWSRTGSAELVEAVLAPVAAQDWEVGAVQGRSAYKERQREEEAALVAGPVRDGGARPARCQACGQREQHARSQCPARDSKCHRCGERGHWKPRCPRDRGGGVATGANRSQVADIHSVFAEQVLAVDAPTMDARGFCASRRVIAEFFEVGGGRSLGSLSVMPDTGATASLMSRADYRSLREGSGGLVGLEAGLRAANGTPIATDGTAVFMVSFGGRRVEVPFTVTPAYAGTLLCCAACEMLGVVTFPDPVGEVSPAAGGEPREEAAVLGVAAVAPVDEPSAAELAAWQASVFEEFGDVFDDGESPLQAMAGEPMRITLRAGAVPTRVMRARPMPLAMREDAKALLDDLEKRGVVKRMHEPTDWVHPMTCVRKPTGKLRLCVDLRGLNRYVERPVHPIRPPKEVVAVVPPGSAFFSTFDASSGYFQMPLDEASQPYTTFITPWGRYANTRATMGLSASSDEYNRRGDAAMEGLSNLSKIVDDVLVFADTFAGHRDAVRAFLSRCREHRITLNRAKTKLGLQSVKFAGYVVGREGVAADPAKLRALREFPRPENITDLRSFLGLVEQLAGFTGEGAAAMGPLRLLLSSRNPFVWDLGSRRSVRGHQGGPCLSSGAGYIRCVA